MSHEENKVLRIQLLISNYNIKLVYSLGLVMLLPGANFNHLVVYHENSDSINMTFNPETPF